MSERTLYLKKNKNGLLRSSHPWIFDGAIDGERSGDVPAGVARLLTSDRRFAAVGTYNPRSAMAFRVLDKRARPIDEAFFIERFEAARALRDAVIGADTDGFRLVSSEGDGLAGLTVDSYAGHLVVQVGTPAMDALSPLWLGALERVFSPRSVVRKDSQSVANREHMTAVSAVLLGETPAVIRFQEAGVLLSASVLAGQKTGYYFDQREHRLRVSRLAAGKRLLDGYAYTGGFGAHALAGGAAFVTGVDSSARAVEMAAANYALNSAAKERFETVTEDCVRFLKQTSSTFDVAVLDPPALAMRRHHLAQAGRLYREIFEHGLRRLSKAGGFLLACSCSAAVDRGTLLDILRQAAEGAGRSAQILHVGGAGADHPVSIHHPEGEYLKSALLRIGRSTG